MQESRQLGLNVQFDEFRELVSYDEPRTTTSGSCHMLPAQRDVHEVCGRWTVVATKALRMVDRCQAAADHDAAVQTWSPEPDNTSRCCSEVRGCCRCRRWTTSSRAEVRASVKLLLPYHPASRLVWQYATLSCCDAALLFCSYFNCSRCIYLLVGPSSELVINFDSGHCLIAVTVIAAVCK